jgi:hypothetical protein
MSDIKTAKGYVVRGTDERGDPLFSTVTGMFWRGDLRMKDLFANLDEVHVEAVNARRIWNNVKVYAVHDDRSETPVPSYGDAMAELVKLRAVCKAIEDLILAPPIDPTELPSYVSDAIRIAAESAAENALRRRRKTK